MAGTVRDGTKMVPTPGTTAEKDALTWLEKYKQQKHHSHAEGYDKNRYYTLILAKQQSLNTV
jgi:hypothetical protein